MGPSLAALGGARRTASAFYRYLTATEASQLSINANPYRPATVEAMRSLPGVVSVQSYVALPVQIVDGRTGEPTPVQPVEMVASIDGLFLDQDRMVILEGQLPDPRAVDPVLVSRSMAEQAHLKPGDQMHFGAADPRTFAPLRQLTATVAGVGVMPPWPWPWSRRCVAAAATWPSSRPSASPRVRPMPPWPPRPPPPSSSEV